MKWRALLLFVLCLIPVLCVYSIYAQINTPDVIDGPVAIVRESFTPARVGPAENFFASGLLYEGRRYLIVGQDTTGTWWQIEYDEDRLLWVEQTNITVEDVENVPVVETKPCVNAISPTCPVSESLRIAVAQLLEDGIMLHWDGSHYTYWLSNSGRYSASEEDWNGQNLTLETPPDGLPETTFGYIWLNTGMGDSLGWATGRQVVYFATLEISSGTMYMPSDDMTYIRLPDGHAVGLSWYSMRWHFVDETQ